MKYDVFISSKSEDYRTAQVVCDFLKSKGVSVFLASESLKKAGNAEYLNEIDSALESCRHLILFTTRREYAESKFVMDEWQTFRNEKLSGRKDGNLLSILGNGMTIGDLPVGLRKYQVIKLEDFRDTLMDYLPNCGTNGQEGRKESNEISRLSNSTSKDDNGFLHTQNSRYSKSDNNEEKKNAPFLMVVSDTYSIKGRGSVVTGKIESGSIKVGDALAVFDLGLIVHITGIEKDEGLQNSAHAGDFVGILLSIIYPELEKGMVLCSSDSRKISTQFKALIYGCIESSGKNLNGAYNVCIGKSMTTARITFPQGTGFVQIGETANANVYLSSETSLVKGVLFWIADNDEIIGYGEVLEVL